MSHIELLQGLARQVMVIVQERGGTSDMNKEVGMGADGTPTKGLDLLAEGEVLRLMQEKNMPFNLLSEEAGFVDRGHSETLVLDPIDGTHNATTGIPFYCVSLAIGKSHLSDVTQGLVKDLVRGDEYWAERGEGAFHDGQPISVGEYREEAIFSIPLNYMTPDANYTAARLPRRARHLGSAALEMCMLSEGVMDIYYNQSMKGGSLRIVDIAASSLILREAGGEVFGDDFEPLDMEFDARARKNVLAVRNLKYMEMVRDAVMSEDESGIRGR